MSDLERQRSRFERKMRALREKGFLPQPLLDLIDQAAALQHECLAGLNGAMPSPDKVASGERSAQGAPLLARGDFPYDEQRAVALLRSLVETASKAGEPLQEACERLAELEREGWFDPAEALRRYLADDEEYFGALAEKTPTAPRLALFLAHGALAPALEKTAQKLAEGRFDPKVAWVHGHCPICASPPLIARLQEKEGYRFLTCSFCHHEYRGRRIHCPYCGEDDMEKLSYFSAPEEPGYQVHVCLTCNSYLKTADFRDLDRVSLPVLDDLESLALDVAAGRKGYQRPVLSAWGF